MKLYLSLFLLGVFLCVDFSESRVQESDIQSGMTLEKLHETTQSAEVSISIYPNPVYNRAKVRSSEDISRYVVINAIGKVVKSEIISPSKSIFTTDMSDLDKGMYFIKFYSENNSLLKTYKLLKYDNFS